jgi:uncharacterized protein YjiS (DUF1127 family)
MEYVIKTHIEKPAAALTALRAAAAMVALAPMVWVQRMRKRRELMGLLGQPDYLLKDVGLQRSDITQEGLKRFWSA